MKGICILIERSTMHSIVVRSAQVSKKKKKKNAN